MPEYRRVFEAARDAVLIFDATGHIVEANPAAWEIYGYSRAEFLQLEGRDIVAPSHFHLFEAFKEQTRRSGEFHAKSVDVRKDGSKFPVEVKGAPIQFAGKSCLLAFVRDTSERDRVEAALRESEAKFRSLAEQSMVGFLILQDGQFQYFNEAFVRLSGYTREELHAFTPGHFLETVHPRDREKMLASIRRKEKGNDSEIQYEYRGFVKSGGMRWFHVLSKTIQYGGRPASFAMIRDVTVDKQMRQQLVEAQKLDSLGHLAAGVAHDFNNMLGGIMGYASLLLADETDPRKRASLEGIVHSADRASELTQKLLAFARRGKNVTQAVDLNALVEEVFNLLERGIDEADQVRLVAELADDLAPVDGDPGQLSQVIMNLCVNAKEAMPDGGTITVRTRNHTKTEKSVSSPAGLPSVHPTPPAGDQLAFPGDLTPGRYVVLVVSDTGHGMSAEVQRHLFEPFFTTKQDGEHRGVGLGLAMVYGIVENHHGTIDVTSEVGHGATFRVVFPAGTRPLQASPAPPASNDPATIPRTILVVEDEPLVRQMLEKMLDRLGYRFFSAEDGQRGLELYRDHHLEIDGVVLDMRMPRMDGRETFLALRAINPQVRVLLSSGYGRNEQAQEILDLGARGLLTKPYRLPELCRALEQLFADST